MNTFEENLIKVSFGALIASLACGNLTVSLFSVSAFGFGVFAWSVTP